MSRKKSTGIGGHHSANAKSNEYVTPEYIIKAIGPFDLDPCSPVIKPWPTAKHHYTIHDNGLVKPFFGFVYMNPPYDSDTLDLWVSKMAEHNNGIALLFARTDRNTWHDLIFPKADSIFWLRQRITFYDIHGNKYPHNGGAPNAFIAYGEMASDRLADCGLKGTHDYRNQVSILVMSVDRSWKVVVKTILVKLSEASVDQVYREAETMVPEKVRQNENYKAKIRQMLQLHAKKIKRAVYTL